MNEKIYGLEMNINKILDTYGAYVEITFYMRARFDKGRVKVALDKRSL